MLKNIHQNNRFIYRIRYTEIRLLFVDAVSKNSKNSLYMYGETIAMGVTDDACITWMKQASNNKIVEMIKKTYLDYLKKKNKK